MNILLLASHSVAEYDDIRMFSDLGYDVFCPGGYQDPRNPGESLRPALPDAPYHPDLIEACEQVRGELGDPGPNIDWAKARLHEHLVDWADVIIVHHFPERWIGGQWDRIRDKRVIWRTCGQSDPRLESAMFPLVAQGLEIVRYSPAEERAFRAAGFFAGQDALIRFGKYPKDYGPWIGDNVAVGNITQDMRNRGEATGLNRWLEDTQGLQTQPAGPRSDMLPGGIGGLSYEDMLEYLRHIRTYLYTGTQPASYTLGLIEAMLSGVPVVTHRWNVPGLDWTWLNDLWEGSEIVGDGHEIDHALRLRVFLGYRMAAEIEGELQRQRAIDLFDVAKVGRQWVDFLGAPTRVTYEKATTA